MNTFAYLLTISVICLTLVNQALAVPTAIAYQGQLMSINGLPYNGVVSVAATLFDHDVGGEAIWGPEGPHDVTVTNGNFHIVLGSTVEITDSTISQLDALWIEFSIESDVLQPRQKIYSVPFSIVASNADKLGDIAASEYVTEDELDNVACKVLSSPQSPPDTDVGTLWFNTDTKLLYVSNGSPGGWVPVGASSIPDHWCYVKTTSTPCFGGFTEEIRTLQFTAIGGGGGGGAGGAIAMGSLLPQTSISIDTSEPYKDKVRITTHYCCR